MGEIAEMILNGDLDEETGEWLGEGQGFPRSPSRDARRRREQKRSGPPTAAVINPKDGQEVAVKALRWLWQAAQPTSGMYPGVHWEAAPGIFQRLQRRGLIETFEPHNGAHKTRAIPTDAGLALLNLASGGTL